MMATEMPANSVQALEEQIAALHSMLPRTGAAQALSNMLPFEMPLNPVPPASLQALLPPFPPCKGLSSKPLRWNITESDLQLLEAAFEMDNFPSAFARQQLANELNVSTRQIQVWFQNRRQRSRDKLREGEGNDGGMGGEGKGSAVPPSSAKPPSLTGLSELLAKCEKVANTTDKPAKHEADAGADRRGEADANAATQSSRVLASKFNGAPLPSALPSAAGSPGPAPGSPGAAPGEPPPPLVTGIDAGAPDDPNSDKDKDKVSVGAKRNRRGKTKSEARPPGPLDLLMSQRQQVQLQTQAQLQAQSKALHQMVHQFMATGGAPAASPPTPPPAPPPSFYQLAPPMPQPTPTMVRPTPPMGQPAPPMVQPAPPMVQPAPPMVQPAPPMVQPAPPIVQPTPETSGVAPASLASLAGLLMPYLQGTSQPAVQQGAIAPASVPQPVPPPPQQLSEPPSASNPQDLMALASALSNLAQLAMGVAKTQAPATNPAPATTSAPTSQAPPPAAAFYRGASFGSAAPNAINGQGMPASERLVPLHAFNEKLLGLDHSGLLPPLHVPASRSSSVTADTASLGDDDHINPHKTNGLGLSGLGSFPMTGKSLGRVEDDDQADGDLLKELSELVWGESNKRPCY